jgi:hypothetical protein
VVTEFPVIVLPLVSEHNPPLWPARSGLRSDVRISTNLGLIKCVAVKSAPRTMQMPPTTTYAMPRKGFLPPMMVRVESRMDFVPS